LDGISLLDAIQFYYLLFSPFLTIIILLFWMAANMKRSAKGKLTLFSIISILQFAYSILFFALLDLESNLAIALLCIIPIISIILLYSWTFGRKKTLSGRVFLIMIFIVQVILLILTFILSLIAYR